MLKTGAFVWMNFPAAALDRCVRPCVWLQDAESLSDVDMVVHYCGATTPRAAVADSDATSVFLCAQPVRPCPCPVS